MSCNYVRLISRIFRTGTLRNQFVPSAGAIRNFAVRALCSGVLIIAEGMCCPDVPRWSRPKAQPVCLSVLLSVLLRRFPVRLSGAACCLYAFWPARFVFMPARFFTGCPAGVVCFGHAGRYAVVRRFVCANRGGHSGAEARACPSVFLGCVARAVFGPFGRALRRMPEWRYNDK